MSSAVSEVREYADGQTVPGTPYRVVRLLGLGGMGCVYEVEHIELGRRCVLKALLGELATRTDLIMRMRTEWRALGKLQHRNIVDVLNAGMTSLARPYYVMELLLGETLHDWLDQRRRFTVDEAVRVASEVLCGLEAAHFIGIVHRDIKPANVFITREEEVKVLDFGIATVKDEPAGDAAHEATFGTPRYMSPEQAAGQRADVQADLYAVGLLLFEMLAGEGPFDHVTEPEAQMRAHRSEPAPQLSQFVAVPPELDRVVACALDKSPERRPASAKAMAAMLEPFLPAALRASAGESDERDGSLALAVTPPAARVAKHSERVSSTGANDTLPPVQHAVSNNRLLRQSGRRGTFRAARTVATAVALGAATAGAAFFMLGVHSGRDVPWSHTQSTAFAGPAPGAGGAHAPLDPKPDSKVVSGTSAPAMSLATPALSTDVPPPTPVVAALSSTVSVPPHPATVPVKRLPKSDANAFAPKPRSDHALPISGL